MKSTTVIVCLFAIGGVVLVCPAAGLECYTCTKGMPAFPGIVAEEHDKCYEGKLPEGLLKTCAEVPLVRAACRKSYGKSGSKGIASKGCFVSVAGAADGCTGVDGGGGEAGFCLCHTDKCNSVGQLLPSVVVIVLGGLGYLF